MKLKLISALFIIVILTQSLWNIFPVYASTPFSFTVTTDNNWGTGFCYEFTTENISANPVSDWVISFELGSGTLTSTFGGNFTHSGSTYEIRSPGSYADSLNPGDTINMGFCGTGAGGVSGLALTDYAGMSAGDTGTPTPGDTLQDYSINFMDLQTDVITASSWATGFCRDIVMTNTGLNIINGWELNFQLDASLSSSYSATYSQSGTQHTITPLSWNNNISPGQSFTIGFCSNSTTYDYDWLITTNGQISSSTPGGSNIIGLGSVLGTNTFDTNIYWDKNFPGFGSGSLGNIQISARVYPSLNMKVSAEEMNLGTLVAGLTTSGSLSIEIGTNAIEGVSITARSQSGGLTNLYDNSVQLNNLTLDGIAESYTWASVPNTTNDSSTPTFIATGLSQLEINNITEHSIYSSNAPEAANFLDDIEFIVSVTTEASTSAGDYEDYITFTVTGNF